VPPALENYFLVSFDEILFHGGVSQDPKRVVDMQALLQHATRSEVAPGVYAFAFQVPLFQLGGASGSAVKINFTGDDLGLVTRSALAVFMQMMQRYGPGTVQPDPGNFNVPSPELQVVPDLERLGEVGLTPLDLALAVQALGDGAFVGDYRRQGDTVDLKLIAVQALDANFLTQLGEQPVATPAGGTVPLRSLAALQRVNRSRCSSRRRRASRSSGPSTRSPRSSRASARPARSRPAWARAGPARPPSSRPCATRCSAMGA
jgi:HAE1 family hydrophobic/amphiphilic exporter-1